jgi:hypothetical protein
MHDITVVLVPETQDRFLGEPVPLGPKETLQDKKLSSKGKFCHTDLNGSSLQKGA